MHPRQQPAQPEPPKTPIPGVRHLVAVGSGKGGVGKTTVSVNLAIALARAGRRVGLLDADVYGPNVPLMMGSRETPRGHGERIIPIEKYGVRLMSMGFLSPGDKPLVWRGPMLHNVIQQFLRNVDWGELDYLLIDLPPGTGDVALSLIQTAAISGAVVVTTPSDVSLEDARKAVNMFVQVRVPVFGLVENMSYLIAPGSGERIDVFGQGGGKRTAEQMGVPFLGELALDPQVRIGGDTGAPVTTRADGDPHAAPFLDLAQRVEQACASSASTAPKITVED
jgi:ATP-binding protein involved in chromosome partitioning